jgi:predicted branched-subunit amino acid permease
MVIWFSNNKKYLLEGSKTMSKAGFAIFTWALVTGMAMAESSLSTSQAIGMSFLVYAASAQLAALPLIAGDFPLWTIFVTAIIVNLRFVVFSAGIQPYFKNKSFWKRSVLGYLNGDLNFALFMSRFPKYQKNPTHLPFFLGMSLTNWSIWQIGSLVGIFLAGAVPDAWGLGFAGTLALIAILLPMLDHLSARLAALSALLVALLADGLPYKLSIVLAVIVAILVGIMCDRFIKKERSNA